MKNIKRRRFIRMIIILAAASALFIFPMCAEAYSFAGKLKAPVIKSLKKADNGFAVASNKNSKAKRYQIKHSTSVSFKNSKYKRAEGSRTEVTISGLQEYKRYYVRIRS